MKIKNYFVAALMLCMGMVACETISDETTQPEESPKTFTARLNMTGEINVSQTPMSRFTPDSNDLYGIQVKYRPVSGGSEKYYAYGLFDDLSNLTIELVDNHYYDFEVVMIDDAKEKIYADSILVDSKKYYGYGEPFEAYNHYNASSSNSITKVMNEFEYSEEMYFSTMAQRITMANGNKHNAAAGVDAYYAKIDDYKPVADNEEISVYLKKMVYGLRIVAGDFLTEGSLKVTIDDVYDYYVFSLTPENKTYENTFGYLSYAGSWYTATTDDGARTRVTLDFVWTKADGTKYNYRALDVYVNRLKMTTVNVEFYDDGTVEGNNLVIKYEDTEIEEGRSYTYGDEQGDYEF